MQMRDIKPGVVSALLAAKAKAELSQQTVVHIRNVISAIFRHAKTLGYWRGDLPTENLQCRGKDAREGRSLSANQVRALITKIDPRYRALVTVLATTGLRIGEALALRWRCINLESEVIYRDGHAIPSNSIRVAQ
jgi:integrase